MIYTLRTCQVDRDDIAEFVRISEQEIWPNMGTAHALGMWRVVMGGPERLVVMTRYDNLAHWQDTRNWEPGGDGPAATRARLVKDHSVIALNPLTERRPLEDAPDPKPGVYTIRTFGVARENVARFIDVSENGWWPWVMAGQGVFPLGQWMSIVGPHTRVYMMARYEDMAHWEATRRVGPKPDDPALVDVWEKAAEAIAERAGMVIDTDVRMLRPISARQPRWDAP